MITVHQRSLHTASGSRGTPLHRWVHDPDLRLEGTLGDGFELGQKHVFEKHEPFANLPLSGGGRVHGV